MLFHTQVDSPEKFKKNLQIQELLCLNVQSFTVMKPFAGDRKIIVEKTNPLPCSPSTQKG